LLHLDSGNINPSLISPESQGIGRSILDAGTLAGEVLQEVERLKAGNLWELQYLR
jgi:hypothetical protein